MSEFVGLPQPNSPQLNHEIAPEPIPSLTETLAGQTLTFAGLTGTFEELMAMCPVNLDEATADQKDRFAAKIAVASGIELRPEYEHLLQPPPETPKPQPLKPSLFNKEEPADTPKAVPVENLVQRSPIVLQVEQTQSVIAPKKEEKMPDVALAQVYLESIPKPKEPIVPPHETPKLKMLVEPAPVSSIEAVEHEVETALQKTVLATRQEFLNEPTEIIMPVVDEAPHKSLRMSEEVEPQPPDFMMELPPVVEQVEHTEPAENIEQYEQAEAALIEIIPEQVQSAVLALPEVVQVPLAEYLLTQDAEVVAEMQESLEMMALIADRLHELEAADQGESPEAQQIEAVLIEYYAELCETLGIAYVEAEALEFIQALKSSDYASKPEAARAKIAPNDWRFESRTKPAKLLHDIRKALHDELGKFAVRVAHRPLGGGGVERDIAGVVAAA